jgi:hypothetical protein
MEKKYIYALSLALMMTAGLSSCISDDSSYGDESKVSELSISDVDSSTMPVINVNLGEDCVITPNVKYSGDKSNLSYEWSLGSYTSGSKGTLEVVGTDEKFEYFFTKGGAYYVHLKLTDGEVGLVQEYQVNVNRTFENGYVLVSNDENNNGNLAFIKTMSAEEIAAGQSQVYMEHCLSLMNEGVSDGHLVNAFLAKTTYPKTLTRLLVSTETSAYFLELNTFTILSEIKYADTYPGFKATNFYLDPSYPGAYDATMKKFVNLDITYMFGFEYSYYQNFNPDIIIQYPYEAYGGIYSHSYGIVYPSTLYTYHSYYGYMSTAATDFVDRKILTGFSEAGQTRKLDYYGYVYYTNYEYVITQSTVDGKLYITDVNCDNGTGTDLGETHEFTTTSTPAVPAQGMNVAVSSTYDRYYYAADNSLYMFLLDGTYVLPDKSEYILRFPSNETITYISVNDSTNELYVATYNSSSKRGSLYVYNVADLKLDNQGSIQPKETHKNVADKITYMFKKTSL